MPTGTNAVPTIRDSPKLRLLGEICWKRLSDFVESAGARSPVLLPFLSLELWPSTQGSGLQRRDLAFNAGIWPSTQGSGLQRRDLAFNAGKRRFRPQGWQQNGVRFLSLIGTFWKLSANRAKKQPRCRRFVHLSRTPFHGTALKLTFS
jgi:hypothetical protein